MIKSIFKNELNQIQFEKNGYLLVRNLIPKGVVNKLRELYFKYEKEHWGDKLGMHSTAHTNNYEILRDIHQNLESLTSEYAEKYLTNYKFYLGNFLVKESRQDSLFDIHQDWTCVDEPDYCSFNFWMDLEGMNQSNGRLFFLKGSHRLREKVLRFSPFCPTPWEKIRKIAPQFYTYLDTNPGDVVFLNNSTLHGSVLNTSGKSRLAAVLGAYSSDATLLHYYLEPKADLSKVERYIVDTECLINMPRGQRPHGGKFDGFVSYDTDEVTPEEFVNFMTLQFTPIERIGFYGRKIKQIIFS